MVNYLLVGAVGGDWGHGRDTRLLRDQEFGDGGNVVGVGQLT
jgi:hypothetical protein